MSYRSHNNCCFNDLHAAFYDSHQFYARRDFPDDLGALSQEIDPMIFFSYDEILKESLVSPRSDSYHINGVPKTPQFSDTSNIAETPWVYNSPSEGGYRSSAKRPLETPPTLGGVARAHKT